MGFFKKKSMAELKEKREQVGMKYKEETERRNVQMDINKIQAARGKGGGSGFGGAITRIGRGAAKYGQGVAANIERENKMQSKKGKGKRRSPFDF